MSSCRYCGSDQAKKHCVCTEVSYCGSECQKKDWKRHKAHCPPFGIQKIEGKGNGLVANRKICFGEIIFREKPLLVINNNASENYEDWCQYVVDKVEQLSSENKKVYTTLADNPAFSKTSEMLFIKFKKDYTEERLKYLRILRTNGINVDDQGDTTCVYSRFSLINHSCDPNSMRNLEDGAEMEVTVTAARDIPKGEEILIKYFNQEAAGLIREKRRLKLLNWGFQCNCDVCNLASDPLKVNEKLRETLQEAKEELKMCPANANDVKSLQTQKILELKVISLIRELKTQLVSELPDHLMAVHHIIKLLKKHRQKVREDPDIFRQEAAELAQKLGPKFVAEFQFWDNLTNRTMEAFYSRRKR